MYICICKAVTERQIREAIQSGACTRKDIGTCLQAGTACGKCGSEINGLLRHNRSQGGDSLLGRAAQAAAYPWQMGGAVQEACA